MNLVEIGMTLSQPERNQIVKPGDYADELIMLGLLGRSGEPTQLGKDVRAAMGDDFKREFDHGLLAQRDVTYIKHGFPNKDEFVAWLIDSLLDCEGITSDTIEYVDGTYHLTLKNRPTVIRHILRIVKPTSLTKASP